MKKLLVALVSLTALYSFQPWETLKGNGNMKKETREVGSFTGLHTNGSMNVDISYGTSNSITIEADENLLPFMETTVKNGVLTIKPKDNKNLRSNEKLIVHVSMEKMTEVKLSGSGNVKGNGNFSNDGATDFNLSGSGNVDIAAGTFGSTSVGISGSGNVHISGNHTNTLEARISGSGNIDCSGLNTDDVKAKVSGSGNIKVFANKSIDAAVSGSGDIYYKGKATNVNMKSSGSGKVRKMD